MKKINFLLTITLCLILVIACFTGCGSKDNEVTNTEACDPVFTMTANGGVMGTSYDGVEQYLGIPYATAERFMMPEEISWEGYRSCLYYGNVSPQEGTLSTSNASQWNVFGTTGEMVSNEDCLNLNIWSSETESEELKPVIFWIHGGGFSSGSSHELTFYEGANMAKDGDVVFVSINTRLNYLGFLDLSAYGDEYKYSGNCGTADMVAAIEWVNINIEQFGGDTNNVTIVGQSGGGSKVTTLMGLPSAEGLFQKAIIQSGGTTQTTRTTEIAQGETEALLETLGLTSDDVEQLKTMPYEDLYAACSTVGIQVGPVVDGDYYPDGTFEMSKDIPIMVGNTMAELFSANTIGVWYYDFVQTPYPTVEDMTNMMISNMSDEDIDAAYEALYGENGETIKNKFMEVYPDHNPGEGLYVNNRISGMMGSMQIAIQMAEYGGTAYNYLETYAYPMFGGIPALHTNSDIPFFFRNLDDIQMFIAGDEENAYNLMETMSGAMLEFARNGDPSQEDLEWEPYNPETEPCMVFDTNTELRYQHDRELLEMMAEMAIPAW